MGPHSDPHICIQLCKESEADMESWLDMHTCTDPCTHSNQGVGSEVVVT